MLFMLVLTMDTQAKSERCLFVADTGVVSILLMILTPIVSDVGIVGGLCEDAEEYVRLG
jgi:hypothetical protein